MFKVDAERGPATRLSEGFANAEGGKTLLALILEFAKRLKQVQLCGSKGNDAAVGLFAQRPASVNLGQRTFPAHLCHGVSKF